MTGAPDPLYVQARSVLLDAAEALAPHLDSIVLVGAQAVYMHTGSADLAVAEYTTDADFGIDPTSLGGAPLIGPLLRSRGFLPRENPGGWVSASGIYLDLMVPEALAGKGRRSADLGAHGKRAARRALGLEGAWIDCSTMLIGALDPTDGRQVRMRVAGPGALLVAKLHKLGERVANDDRVKDKDALDIVRILRSIDTTDLAERIRLIVDSGKAKDVSVAALRLLQELFASAGSEGVRLAQRASERLINPDELAGSTVALAGDLLGALGHEP